jgi:hypothetical protein
LEGLRISTKNSNKKKEKEGKTEAVTTNLRHLSLQHFPAGTEELAKIFRIAGL